MELNQLNSFDLAPNDEVIATFCIAISLLAAIGVRYLKENPYFRYFAASFSFFFISTAASALKSLDPVPLEFIEHITLLLSALPITMAAYRYRKVAEELK
ncbi:MAG: hypothetical protein IBX64_02530 [Actinobacteria bacterium]|nr:hypothetical protein [Actinomycetota bacterium]